jgi:transposase
MSNFILTDRKTNYLLPPSVDDWLSQDHLARFVVEVIDGLDLSNLTRQYAGRGSKAHHPATLLAILVYGYSTGVFSSRKLEMAALRRKPTPTYPLKPSGSTGSSATR